ncbi:MAG TPA: hypothetical protein DCG19_04490 [Cryomorphaceae bacterium]|nr:hypothetical protein [Owenweeksia sp.]MBF99694.1 hypothetical protein [Owenweeksia sp.]HAD96640.1 hypothetical protein [Cryomorphaceae bacterium]|tara:strand:+ start:8371 stop:9444 length:1074 start_codon:yes stop_codon:yes gene_type:complete
MKYFVCLLFVALSLATEAQINCEQALECRIVAPSGMRMRAEPSLKAKVVTYVPFDSTLTACQETFGSMEYEKIRGFWRKVQYNGKLGYMFDGFMEVKGLLNKPATTDTIADTSVTDTPKGEVSVKPEKETPKTREITYSLLTETYNYCGEVKGIDPGLIWYGIYPRDEDNGGTTYRIKRVDVNVMLSKQKVGKKLEFDVLTDEEERSIFLLGVNQLLPLEQNSIEDNSDLLRMNGRKIFPGQQWDLTGEPTKMKLSATGSVESTGPCPDLKNYRLTLSGTKYFLPVNQNITEELNDNGQCGMPEIYWFGDLNGDDVPEMIFVSVYEDRNRFTLFVSDPTLDNALVVKKAHWTVDKCY